MRRKLPTRTSSGYYSFALKPHSGPWGKDAANIGLQLSFYKTHGTHNLFSQLYQTVTNIGLFNSSAEVDGICPKPRAEWPFTPDNAQEILQGDFANEWALYGFEVRAYSLILKYYNLFAQGERGMIELGCDFNELQLELTVPSQGVAVEACYPPDVLDLETPIAQRLNDAEYHYVIYLWRHRTAVTSFFGLVRRRYTECKAIVVRSIATVNGKVSRRLELDGEDTQYADLPSPRA